MMVELNKQQDISYREIERLSQLAGDSFYIFSPEKFKKNCIEFRSAFRKYYDKSMLAYSYKANYMPIIGKLLSEIGMYAEVVSRMEYDIALQNVDSKRIIFNGPLKRKDDIAFALKHGSIVNLDSFSEIDLIRNLSSDFCEVKVGIRVNYHIEKLCPSRFGFCLENGAFSQALKHLSSIPNCRISGLHSHFTTKEKSLELFKMRAESLIRIAETHLFDVGLEFIDIGGGFFGKLPAVLKKKFPLYIPNYEEYGECIANIFYEKFQNQGPLLIFEPGVSIVADTMLYVTKVIDVKNINDRKVVLCDSSVNVVNPTKSPIQAEFIILSPSLDIKNKEKFDLVGNTCMEHDIICKSYYGSVSVGDYLVFSNRGAYSNVYKAPFIAPSPTIITWGGQLIKQQENASHIIQTYQMDFD